MHCSGDCAFFGSTNDRPERHAQKVALLDQLLALNNAFPVPTD